MRIVQIIKPSALDALVFHCEKLAQQSEDARKTRGYIVDIHNVFDEMDETQVGNLVGPYTDAAQNYFLQTSYINRPQLFRLMEEFYASLPKEIQDKIRNPRQCES